MWEIFFVLRQTKNQSQEIEKLISGEWKIILSRLIFRSPQFFEESR